MPDDALPDNQPTASIHTHGDGASTVPIPRSGFGEQPGDRIGTYKLLQVIGEGGFGTVWLAERREPMVQRVALKIIKPGMDSSSVIARFEQERQALAVMDHPNVAKVFDGGVTNTGRPYFVMEHVTGEPITAYCDKHRLTIRQRLAVFIPVCEAVQHAHHKGIIHRDIKPSNILVGIVDGRAVPKVIDFGVAKAISHTLTEKSIYTERGVLIGTPEYMSPEQAEMGALDIDTRTDVYSLGVVLYELLSGVLPFDPKSLRAAGYAEVQRIIREEEAPRLSTRLSTIDDVTGLGIARARQAELGGLGNELKRELEWIPLKALRKDRTRRYASPESLAADVRRYLEGTALEAAPESRGYLLRKFVRRNRAPVAAVSAVMLALAAGFGTAVVQAREAAMQRDAALIAKGQEAEQRLRADERAQAAEKAEAEAKAAQAAEKARADELKQVSDFQETMLSQIDTATAGVDLMADVRARFAAELEKAGVPEADRGVQAKTLGDLLVRVNATDTAAAMIDRTILKPAVKAIDEQFKDQPIVDAQLCQALATLYRSIGLYDAAFPLQESALATRRRTLGEEHLETLTSISTMGSLLRSQGKLAEAEPYYREALEKNRRTLGEEHPETLTIINNMGTLLQSQGKLAEAEPYFREALEKSRRVLGEEHPNTLNSINNMGSLLQYQGKPAEAEPYYREALEKSRRVLGEEHPNTLIFISNMGFLLRSQGKLAEAEPYYREALEKSRRVLGEEHPETLTSISNMGSLLQSQGKLDEAEPYTREALEKSRRTLGEEHPSTLISINNMGSLLRSQGKLAEAEPYYREALEKSRRTLGEEHPDTLTSINNMGFLLRSQGKLAEAEPYYREVLEKSRRVLGEEHPNTLIFINNMGGLLRQQGKFAEAIDLLKSAEPATREAFTGANAVRLAAFLTALGSARVGLGYDAERFMLAESNLLEAHPLFVSAKDRGPTHKDTLGCVQGLVDLYSAWDAAEPGKGYAAKGAEWKAKLDAASAPPAEPQAPEKK